MVKAKSTKFVPVKAVEELAQQYGYTGMIALWERPAIDELFQRSSKNDDGAGMRFAYILLSNALAYAVAEREYKLTKGAK